MISKKKYFWNQRLLNKLKLERNFRKIAQSLRHTDIKWLIEDYKIIGKEFAKQWKRQLYYANLKRLNSGIYTRNYARKIERVKMIKGKSAAYAVTEEDFAQVSKLIEQTIMSDIHRGKKFLSNKIKQLLRLKNRKVYEQNKYLIPSFEQIKNTFLGIANINKKNGKVLGGKYRMVGAFEKGGHMFYTWERLADHEEVTIGPSDTDDWSDETVFIVLERIFNNQDIIKKRLINNS